MEVAIISLLSAVTVALLNIVGQYLINRRNRKDVKEDKAEQEDNKVLEAIGELSTKVDSVIREVDALKAYNTQQDARQERSDAKQARIRILRFADELSCGIKHSKGHFQDIMCDCDEYKSYCKAHEEFVNGMASHAIKLITDTFDELDKKGFN